MDLKALAEKYDQFLCRQVKVEFLAPSKEDEIKQKIIDALRDDKWIK